MNSKENKKKKDSTFGEIIRYIIVGGCVTLGQLLLIVVFNKIIPGNGTGFGWSNLISGFIMMLVAFFPYKIIVFRSKNWNKKAVAIELVEFISARIFTVLFDIGFVFLFVTFLKFDSTYPIHISRVGADGIEQFNSIFPLSFVLAEKWIVKFFSLAITTILNFLFSKLIVFKNKTGKRDKEEAEQTPEA